MRVLKFGGQSLSTTEKINKIAHKISEFKDPKLIVVVSAMGDTTSKLLHKATEVSSSPLPAKSHRELDMLLASGERVSASLFCLALQKHGLKAISFTGSQAGILTKGPHNDATIKEIRPIRVDQALEEGFIPVIAGFQGVDPTTKDITTLGRGGSDLTACALAHHYSCRAELYKNVGGVFTCDPQLVQDAQVISKLNLQFLKNLSFWGGKVLHDKAALYVQEKKVPLSFLSDESFEVQTEVLDQHLESFSLACLDYIVALKVADLRIPEALLKLKEKLGSHPFKVLASAFNQQDSRFLISTSKESFSFFTTQKEFEVLDQDLTAVSLIFSSPQTNEFWSKVVSSLEGLEIKRFLETENQAHFFVSPKIKMELLKKLHSFAL